MKRATGTASRASISAVISIHALVKRATDFTKGRYNIDNISIHALVKRATTYIEHTTHEDGISIHALVKRATEIAAIT